jgi:hypothetical protein
MKVPQSKHERYRTLVSLLFMPLGVIIIVRAALVGWQAWSLILMGLAFVALGWLRLRTAFQKPSPSTEESRGSRGGHKERSRSDGHPE